jgi:hypothetical protein
VGKKVGVEGMRQYNTRKTELDVRPTVMKKAWAF